MHFYLTQANIIRATRGGLKIYAFIFRKYGICEQILFDGNKSLPLRNPFNGGRRTLMIEMRGELAVHRDLQLAACTGTALDYAQLHFRSRDRAELCRLLNQLLGLGLREHRDKDLARLNLEDVEWVPEVSFFKPPVSNIRPSVSLRLAELQQLIMGPRFEKITTELRSMTDPASRRRFKASRFPYVTFAGVFDRRHDGALKRYSQLMVFDFDHLPDVEEVRHLLLNRAGLETEMLFVSPSGHGLKWIVRVEPLAADYRNFFLSVSNYLKQEFGLQPDKAGDLSRACFIPKDEFCYLHPRHRSSWVPLGKLAYRDMGNLN